MSNLKNLQNDEEEAGLWAVVRAVMQEREAQRPPERVWKAIQAQISAPQALRVNQLFKPAPWAVGIFLALLVMVGLWAIVQPGIALNWSVSGQLPQSFRVYRAASGSSDYTLLREIKAETEITRYQFVDAFLIPGRSYSYRVEGVGQVGDLAVSQNVTIPPLQALPAQLAVIFTGLAAGYCATMLLKLWRDRPQILILNNIV